MLLKSQIITAGSGSIGGLTLSRNRFGLYFRARAKPVDPGTTYQQAVRNAVAQLATRWQSVLTTAQRSAWDTYAANVPVVGRLGDPINLTGLNMYVRCNTPRIQASQTVIDDGPTDFGLGTFTPGVATCSEATQVVSVTFTAGDEWVDEDDAGLLMYVSRPKSPAINYFRGPYRFAHITPGDSTTPPTSPATGAVPFAVVEGQKLFVAIRVSRADGRLTSEARLSCIVAA